MPTCPSCQRTVANDQPFCGQCGSSLGTALDAALDAAPGAAPDAWGMATAAFLLVAYGVGIFGFRVALAGRPLFHDVLQEA